MVNFKRCVINYVNSIEGFKAEDRPVNDIEIRGRFGARTTIYIYSDPSLSQMEHIANELEVSLSELLTYDNEEVAS